MKPTFETYAAQKDEALDLALGAALLARDSNPDVDALAVVEELRGLGHAFGAGVLAGESLETQAKALSDYMYGELRFRGNRESYYDVRNSYLPDVLTRKLGIPITLALVHAEIAKIAGVRAHGVSFPGHYLVRLDTEDEVLFIDPFEAGRPVTATDLQAMLVKTGHEGELNAHLLAPASTRATLVRLLVNLKWAYALRHEWVRVLLTLDRILALVPDASVVLRERAHIALQLGSWITAKDDLLRLRVLEPHAPDLAQIQAQVERAEKTGGPLVLN